MNGTLILPKSHGVNRRNIVNRDLELVIIKNYIVSNKRERAEYELFHPKKREKFIWDMDAKHYINKDCIINKINGVDSYTKVYQELVGRGFHQTCYVLSLDKTYDSKIIDLKNALHGLVFNGPALLCSFDGELAYFEGEPDLGDTTRVVLSKRLKSKL